MVEALPPAEDAHGARHRRAGWDAAFRKMAERGDDALLDAKPPASSWDAEEWDW